MKTFDPRLYGIPAEWTDVGRIGAYMGLPRTHGIRNECSDETAEPSQQLGVLGVREGDEGAALPPTAQGMLKVGQAIGGATDYEGAQLCFRGELKVAGALADPGTAVGFDEVNVVAVATHEVEEDAGHD